jgi:hypothetical protein
MLTRGIQGRIISVAIVQWRLACWRPDPVRGGFAVRSFPAGA